MKHRMGDVLQDSAAYGLHLGDVAERFPGRELHVRHGEVAAGPVGVPVAASADVGAATLFLGPGQVGLLAPAWWTRGPASSVETGGSSSLRTNMNSEAAAHWKVRRRSRWLQRRAGTTNLITESFRPLRSTRDLAIAEVHNFG